MSAALDESLEGLDDCGCCAGVDAAVPVRVQNRAGLPAIAYRVGTYATFYETLLARLTSPGAAALQPLSARDDDFTPALLDAWAVVGDVLTFYQERIANEQYLRTATERRSVLELARAIGYELAPGAAAATWLAFTLEDAPGAPAEVVVAKGTRAQSLPGPGEKPQSFETVEEVAARPGWNSLLPRPTRPQALGAGGKGAWIRGATTAIRAGCSPTEPEPLRSAPVFWSEPSRPPPGANPARAIPFRGLRTGGDARHARARSSRDGRLRRDSVASTCGRCRRTGRRRSTGRGRKQGPG